MRMEYFPMGLNFDDSLKVRYVITRGRKIKLHRRDSCNIV